MSAFAERLRGVLGPPPPSGVPARGASRRGSIDDVAGLLGGTWREAGGQRCLVVDRTYPLAHRHGQHPVEDGVPPAAGWPRLSLLSPDATGRGLLFFDLETTGLAGGAGTYAFLVGCAWFDDRGFHTRQFFLSTFAAERVMLESVGALTGGSTTVVTYNGKSFDLPLIETRYAMHRMATPFAAMSHLDLLHPARRLWRDRGRSGHAIGSEQGDGCRLTTLEQSRLGYERRGDVPGAEIPARYFAFVHSGDAAPLEGVLEHNRLDLLSLGLLTARAARLLEHGARAAGTGGEALGLGVVYERAGLAEEALACFARAASSSPARRAEAWRAAAVLLRRLRRYEEAAATWGRLLALEACPSHLAREASEALAVHHEHRLRDPLSARDFALRSLGEHGRASQRLATAHRLARLNRKLGQPPGRVPLFS